MCMYHVHVHEYGNNNYNQTMHMGSFRFVVPWRRHPLQNHQQLDSPQEL